jgi:hypothetical protein
MSVMKLLLHVAFICGALLGSDFAMHKGSNTKMLLREGTPKEFFVAVNQSVYQVGSALRRQVGRILD